MFCSKCGKQLPDNANFCDGCGQSLGQPAAQAAPAGQTNQSVQAATNQFKAYTAQAKAGGQYGWVPLTMLIVAAASVVLQLISFISNLNVYSWLGGGITVMYIVEFGVAVAAVVFLILYALLKKRNFMLISTLILVGGGVWKLIEAIYMASMIGGFSGIYFVSALITIGCTLVLFLTVLGKIKSNIPAIVILCVLCAFSLIAMIVSIVGGLAGICTYVAFLLAFLNVVEPSIIPGVPCGIGNKNKAATAAYQPYGQQPASPAAPVQPVPQQVSSEPVAPAAPVQDENNQQ